MQTELKTKWIEALRSGEYRQAQGILKDVSGSAYCCLGVLCEISGIGSFEDSEYCLELTPEQQAEYDYDEEMAYAEGELSLPMLDSFGLNSTQQSTLIQMNDNDLSPFNEIADWIEKNL